MKEEKTNSFISRDGGETPYVFTIEIGSQLRYIVEGGSSSRFVAGVNRLRRSLEKEWGFELPLMIIKENLLLNERTYRFLFQDRELVKRKVYPGKTLIIASAERLAEIPGKIDSDPIYSKPCVWTETRDSLALQTTEPYTATIETLILEHLEIILRANTANFITKEQISRILTEINHNDPGVVHDVLSRINMNGLHTIMKNLVSEGIPLTSIYDVMQALTQLEVPDEENFDIITENLRKIFRDKIHNHAFSDRLLLFTMPDTKLQLWIYSKTKKGKLDEKDPIIKNMISELVNLYISFQGKGFRLGVICSSQIRLTLRRLLEKHLPDVVVLKPEEIDPEKDIMVIKKLDASGFKIWFNWRWFWLFASGSEKREFQASLKSLFEVLERRNNKLMLKKAQLEIAGKNDAKSKPKTAQFKSENLPAEPGNYLPKQKIALFFHICSTDYLGEVFHYLSMREIAVTAREMMRIPSSAAAKRNNILDTIDEIRGRWQDPTVVAEYLHNILTDEGEPVSLSPLQKLAVLISTLSPGAAERVYSKVLQDMSRGDLEEIAFDSSDYKFSSSLELRVSVVEDFMWFYKGSYQPSAPLSASHWLGDLQRIALRSPKKASMAVRDIWLEGIGLLERFDHFVFNDPNYASLWMKRYITSKKENTVNLTIIEKAMILISALPPELAESVIKRLDKTWQKVMFCLPSTLCRQPETTGKILYQFLSHYYSVYNSANIKNDKFN
ncbi:MAG: FHIPEP family type III secretion protein [Firmicutes bacterium]|nr:FHIPEP family type III secretion protein [Bacillota bacterium]